MYGFSNTEELVSNNAGTFGLNTGAKLVKFEFNPNAGKDGVAQDALDIVFKIEEREFNHRLFPLQKFQDEDDETFKKRAKVFSGCVVDIVKCFVPQDTIKTALSAPMADFKQFAETVVRLVKSNTNWDKTPLDLFLQYQWQIRNGSERTFLEVPRYGASYHGVYVVPSKGPGFKRVEDSTSLKYVNAAGEEHPFKRSEWFMNSNFAKLQELNKVEETQENPFENTSDAGSIW